MIKREYDRLQGMRGLKAYNEAFINLSSIAGYYGGLHLLLDKARELGYYAHFDENGTLIAFLGTENERNKESIFGILSEGSTKELEVYADNHDGCKRILENLASFIPDSQLAKESETRFEMAA